MSVHRVPVPVRTRAPTGKTAAYVVGDGDALLVDPADWTDDLAAAAAARDVGHVAVTHHHPDHVGGLADAVADLDLTVWARAGRTDDFAAATGVDPDRSFAAGDTIPAGSGVSVLDTPGHAPEHVAFAAPDGLVSGDLAVAEGSVVVGAPEGDMRAYVSSLRRLHARDPDRLYPGHGPVVEDPRATCRRLVDHRIARERKVEAAVAEGATTPDGILDAAYDKDVSAVRDLARATVVAHLEKLAVEGRVRWDGATAGPP
ncbi:MULTISPECIES: MBL fold metallo-hydrolase [Salinibaculum]|uniref:MBL fold metallo-hydrolase n=1 Tax=Salinibaculum TaxID=2732368 RepID=UPI0030D4F855